MSHKKIEGILHFQRDSAVFLNLYWFFLMGGRDSFVLAMEQKYKGLVYASLTVGKTSDHFQYFACP